MLTVFPNCGESKTPTHEFVEGVGVVTRRRVWVGNVADVNRLTSQRVDAAQTDVGVQVTSAQLDVGAPTDYFAVRRAFQQRTENTNWVLIKAGLEMFVWNSVDQLFTQPCEADVMLKQLCRLAVVRTESVCAAHLLCERGVHVAQHGVLHVGEYVT